MTRRLIALTVVGLLCCCQLLDGDPPDPSSIAGFWDGAEHDDDIVVRITKATSAAETGPLCALEPHWLPIWSIPLADDQLTPSPAFASHQPRGPPIA